MKVLIVDDNFNDRKGIAECVNWNAFGIKEVLCAKNGLEGLEIAKREKPNLILTDVSMPIMDGIKMTEKISEVLPDTKYIFFSCFDNFEYLTSAIDNRAFGYLLKPIDIELLEKNISMVLKVEHNEREKKQELSLLQDRLNQYAPLIESALLRDYILGVPGTVGDCCEFGFRSGRCFNVAIVNVIATQCTNSEIYTKTYEIGEMVSQLQFDDVILKNFVLGSNCLVIITEFNAEHKKEREIDESLLLFEKIKEMAKEQNNTDINICIGGVTSDFTELPKLFYNAEFVLKSGYVYNSIMVAENFKNYHSSFEYNYKEMKNQLSDIIQNGDIVELEKFIDDYASDIDISDSYSLQAFGFFVLCILQIILLEENESFENVFGEKSSVWKKMQDYKTIFNIKNWLYNIIKSIIEYMGLKNEKHYETIIKQIKNIIAKECGNISNISQITQKLYISPSYANHIFKKYEGKTIFKYMSDEKINKAKELLKNTDMKIYEVANTLGYETNSYFGMVFKEKVGMTPKQYREENNISKR